MSDYGQQGMTRIKQSFKQKPLGTSLGQYTLSLTGIEVFGFLTVHQNIPLQHR